MNVQKPRVLTSVLLSFGALTAAYYLARRKLNQTCPRVPPSAIPSTSACHHILGRAGETTAHPAWGLEKSVLLSSWRSDGDGDENKTHWIPSFAVIQVEVPVSDLATYGKTRIHPSSEDGDLTTDEIDTPGLLRNLVAAFLDSRARGPEAWFLDQDVPPLSFTPGTHLFGRKSGLGAFLLGTWSPQQQLDPDLPGNITQPVCEFPFYQNMITLEKEDAAGAVIYWRCPNGVINPMNHAAARGSPWRIMDGGFQEFIVERVSEKARVTYISVECASLYPLGQADRDFKRMPWVVYELHVLYAQVLLRNAMRQLRG